jgi:hypothetical protein
LAAEAGVKPTVNEEEPPGAMESGKTSPEEVKPVPAREACVTLRAAVLGLRMVMVCVLFTPTLTLPKVTLEGMTEIWVCTPVPESAIVSGELAALLTTVILPARLPVVVGANATRKEVDCPPARLKGSPSAALLNPAPLSVICEMETLEFPVFEIVTVRTALVPVVRLPKLSDAGDAESWRFVEMPVPASGTTSEEFGALLMSVMLPEKVLADAGVNPTLKTEEPPGGTESGRVNPEEVKPVPTTEACVTVRVAVPGFRMVTVWVAVVATLIFPKLRLDGVTEICGCTPVPPKEIVAGELVALLTTLTLPEREPAEVGAKLTLKDVDWPVARLSGSVIPLVLKPVPLALI